METHAKNSTKFISSIYINDIDNKYNQYYYGKVSNKKCWFCDSSCKNFVNICNECKLKKLKKLKNIY